MAFPLLFFVIRVLGEVELILKLQLPDVIYLPTHVSIELFVEKEKAFALVEV
jgi:hypothetical protein